MRDLTSLPNGSVAHLQRALRDRTWGHSKLHAELRRGNPYAHAYLARRGLTYTPEHGIHKEGR